MGIILFTGGSKAKQRTRFVVRSGKGKWKML